MEFYIRTQDRMRIVQPKRLGIKKVGGNNCFEHQYIIYESENNMRYGVYNSKERALEVLDEIWNLLKPDWAIERLNKIKGNMNNLYPILTYEMPEE